MDGGFFLERRTSVGGVTQRGTYATSFDLLSVSYNKSLHKRAAMVVITLRASVGVLSYKAPPLVASTKLLFASVNPS
ncbi:UNVERIFIED_CONTAM: hypothetical protein Slati_0233500 [Sesamum latifolium]|uniref:Uncharacterized protein n=1 Tax=Sesamum latifolium TaxID=2727402 RepID=A0AAW2YCJ6_9LAMI